MKQSLHPHLFDFKNTLYFRYQETITTATNNGKSKEVQIPQLRALPQYVKISNEQNHSTTNIKLKD